MAGEIVNYRIERTAPESRRGADDYVVVEEPLEIRVDGVAQAVLMRTPLADFDLAVGFCLTEQLVAAPDDIAGVGYGDPAEFNVVEIRLQPGVPAPDPELRRLQVTSASCGICGKRTIDAVRLQTGTISDDTTRVRAETVWALPVALRAAQSVFDATGGLHAAGLFTDDGDLVCVREDVGRHNTVDKVCGHLARTGTWPRSDSGAGGVLCVSGRAGFEIVQKAAVAGIPVVVAVSAPSSAAIDLAEECGLTLVAFARDRSANVYTHPHRVV